MPSFYPDLSFFPFSMFFLSLFLSHSRKRRVVQEDQYSIWEETKCESISNKSMLLCSQALEKGGEETRRKFVESSKICKDIFNDLADTHILLHIHPCLEDKKPFLQINIYFFMWSVCGSYGREFGSSLTIKSYINSPLLSSLITFSDLMFGCETPDSIKNLIKRWKEGLIFSQSLPCTASIQFAASRWTNKNWKSFNFTLSLSPHFFIISPRFNECISSGLLFFATFYVIFITFFTRF